MGVLVYVGSVKGLMEALRLSRKSVMSLGTDKLDDPIISRAVHREFNRVQTKEMLSQLRGGGSIA